MIFNCWLQQPKYPPGCRGFWRRGLSMLPPDLLIQSHFPGLQAYYFQMLEEL
jgi:hypothetical protein